MRRKKSEAAYSVGQPIENKRSSVAFWGMFLVFVALATAIPMLLISGLNYRTVSQLKASKPAVASAQTPTVVSDETKIDTPAPQPVDPQPTYDTDLRALLVKWTSTHPRQQWSVVIEGLDSHTPSANINADLSYQTASLYKLLLTYTLMQKTDLAAFPTTNVQVNGQPKSLTTCVDLMLRVSDNPCGEAVGAWLGWSKINQDDKKLGLTATNLANSAGPTTTAADVANYLKALNSGSYFSDQQRQYILDTLKHDTWNKGIPTGCVHCEVANKTGDLSNVRHDAAIINDNGSTYALVIMTNGASYAQIAQLTGQIQTYLNSRLP
jgi:beta-lactamase class A